MRKFSCFLFLIFIDHMNYCGAQPPRPTPFPTSLPSLAPTSPPRPIWFLDIPNFFVAGSPIEIRFRFTDEFISGVSTNFEFDVALVTPSNDVQDAILIGGASTNPEIVISYTAPDDLNEQLSYRIRVVEYVQNYAETSTQPMKYLSSFTPTYVPTSPAPTTPTVFIAVKTSEGSNLDFGDSSMVVFPGEVITMTVVVTGDLIVMNPGTTTIITVYLCRGTVSVDTSDICATEETGFVEIVVLGQRLTDPSAGFSIDYQLPTSLDGGTDFYFAAFYYLSTNRRLIMNEATDPGNADGLFFTDTFTLTPYAPTNFPSYIPSVSPTPRPTGKTAPSPTRVPVPAPTNIPTRSPTLSFSPTYMPTLFPTVCGVIIRRLPEVWLHGATVQILLELCADIPNRVDSFIDILLYQDNTKTDIENDIATPVDTIVERAFVSRDAEDFTFTYDVPDSLADGLDYRLRVLEYGNGFARVSDPFQITAEYSPTLSPTAPGVSVIATKQGQTLLYNQNDFLLAPGDSIRLSAIYYGPTWPFADDTIEVSVRLCVGSCTDSDTIVQSLIFSADISRNELTSRSQAAILSASLETRLDYRFYIEVQDNGDVFTTGTFPIGGSATTSPSYAPTSSEPTYVPTHMPSSVPTVLPTTLLGIRLNLDDGNFWINGQTISITVTVDDNVDLDTGFLDILLYTASFASGDEPIATIVSYLEFELEASTSFEYTVNVPPGNYRVRAIEYVLGFDVTSTVVTIVDDFPTYQPTPVPTEFNPVLVVEVPGGRRLDFGVGDFLIVGFDYRISPWDTSTESTISICSIQKVEDNVCTSVLTTVSVATTTPVVFTPTEALLNAGELVFQALRPGGTAFISGSFFAVGYSPTLSPTSIDTTAAPSVPQLLLFRPAFETTWVLGTQVTITLMAQSAGVIDILVYEAPAPDADDPYVEPVDAVAIYTDIDAGATEFKYDVESLIADTTYQLRAIDYAVGADVISEIVRVVQTDTYSPTLSPTDTAPEFALTVSELGPNGAVLQYDADDSLFAGVEYSARLATTLPPVRVNSVTVSICRSSAVGKDGRCTEISQSVAFAVPVSTVFTFEPLESLAGRGDLVFQLWGTTTTESVVVLTGTFQVIEIPPTPPPTMVREAVSPTAYVPTIRPTYIPTSLPTTCPTIVPTNAGIQVIVEDFVWNHGTTQSLRLALTGLSSEELESPAYVDVYLYEASDVDRSPVLPILASGAEMTDGILDLSVEVASSILGRYRIRAVEYTFGYVSESSEDIVVTDSVAPSAVPTAHPSPLPSFEPSTAAPSSSPTNSGLFVSASVRGEPLGTTVTPGTNVRLVFRYTGELVRASGTITVRLCDGTNNNGVAYNGPASVIPFETCESLVEIVFGQSFERSFSLSYQLSSDLGNGPMYFRADAIIDRDGLYTTWADENTYVLAYQSEPFRINYSPSALPTGLTDSTSWYKRASPSKDCNWVQSFTLDDGQRPRCGAFGENRIPGYEACLQTCRDYVPD